MLLSNDRGLQFSGQLTDHRHLHKTPEVEMGWGGKKGGYKTKWQNALELVPHKTFRRQHREHFSSKRPVLNDTKWAQHLPLLKQQQWLNPIDEVLPFKVINCDNGLNSIKGIYWIKRKAEQYCLHQHKIFQVPHCTFQGEWRDASILTKFLWFYSSRGYA